MIDKSTIEEIKARIDIVDLISKHLDLRKMGKNYSACCPFHNEKTPSFTVNQGKQFYYCFGCGATGDVIRFYSEYNMVGFNDSVEKLSQLAGIAINKTNEVLVPKNVKEMIVDDKIIMIMSQDYEDNGVKMSYADKQRKKLALARHDSLTKKWGK